MSASHVCEACDTLTMMEFCPKCDSHTVLYEPRGSGTLCVGPPRRAPSVPLSHHGGEGGRLSLSQSHVVKPYEALTRRVSPSVDRHACEAEEPEDSHEQLLKERELMIQSANDILRITDAFQLAQKKSIRVIDRLYQENQELKVRVGLPSDSDPQGWRRKFGFHPSAAAPAARPKPIPSPTATRDPPAQRNDPRRGGQEMRPYEEDDYDDDDDLLEEIERRAKAVETQLEGLLNELNAAERLASVERQRISSHLEGARVSHAPTTQRRLVHA